MTDIPANDAAAPLSHFAALGFDSAWLFAMYTRHGAKLWELLTRAQTLGFSKEFIVEALDKLHPLLLDVVRKLLGVQEVIGTQMGAADDAVGAIPKEVAIGVLESLLEMLPTLLSGWSLVIARSVLTMLIGLLK